VLYLVDLVEGDQVAGRPVGKALVAEELAEDLEQAADRLVVALGPGRPGPQCGGDRQDQVDLPGEHRVDLGELLGGHRLAAVRVELEVGPVRLEERAERLLGVGTLRQQPPVHDVLDVGGREVDAQARREAALRPAEDGVVRLLLELLLPERQQPGAAAKRSAERRREGPQPVHPVLVGEDVLGDLVDDQEERGARLAEPQHVPDGRHGLVGRLGTGVGAAVAGEPGHRVGVSVGK
jgi:hypothetical protein